MSFSFPPATKFASNSRNDAFLARNVASIRAKTGKPRSSARSRTIYLNFAFIVAPSVITYTTLHSCFLNGPFLSFESQSSACLRGFVKRMMISKVSIEIHVSQEKRR